MSELPDAVAAMLTGASEERLRDWVLAVIDELGGYATLEEYFRMQDADDFDSVVYRYLDGCIEIFDAYELVHAMFVELVAYEADARRRDRRRRGIA